MSDDHWLPVRRGALDHLDDAILRNVLFSRPCGRAVLTTMFICSSIHIVVGWGLVSNWNEHHPLPVCLVRWSRPAGYGGLPLSMLAMWPADAVMLAAIVCLVQMPRILAVQRGDLPYLPPGALHRGALAFLFPRGCAALPKLSSWVGVALVWGACRSSCPLPPTNTRLLRLMRASARRCRRPDAQAR